MMQQSKNPVVVDLSNDFKNNEAISEKELVYQLTKSSKGAVLLSEDKRKFLLDIQKN